MSSVECLVKQGNSTRAASAGARVGYTRVSTVAQTLEQQNTALAAAGVTKTFSDTMSGAKDVRPGLAALMDYVRDGDTVVVWKLDRLGSNTLHILETVKELTDAGVTLISTTDGIDSSTAGVREGRLTAQQLAEEIERLGRSISRSQIANYESGRKQSLDVAELLVIAAALGVSPLSLLFPGEPDDQVEILPNRQTPTFFSKAWFSGDLGSISRQVAGLMEQLGRIDRAIAMVGASLTSEGTLSAPVEVVQRGEQETK